MNTTFDSFLLAPAVLRGVAALGFTTPTPVQAVTIPLLLDGRDAIVQAETGSGKTLAFGLPLLSILGKRQSRPRALVILPTRELALQVCDAINAVQGPRGSLRVVPVYGGAGFGTQQAALERGVDIVVGTPGRLKDFLDRGTLDLSGIRILVLDEADQMLDMGFRPDIERFIGLLPAREQTLVFSATMPPEIERIARRHLNAPAVVKLIRETEETPAEIGHEFVRVPRERRLDALVALLGEEDPLRALVFVQMKHETSRLARKLQRITGWPVGFLNGNMSQSARNAALAAFREGKLRILVATDVAARGLDVNGLSHVFHYAVPEVVETYIHRSGRTGRAGNRGLTITLVVPDSEADFALIRQRILFTQRDINLRALPVTDVPRVSATVAPSDRRRREQAQREQERPERSNREKPRRERSRTSAGPAMKRFRFSLHNLRHATQSSLPGWLCSQTGLPPSVFGNIRIVDGHAVVEVDSRYSDRFKRKWAARFRA